MTAAAWPVQTAIHARLTGDTGLMGRVSGVYDHVLEDAAHPYITIGESTENPADAHDRRGAELTVTLHIWSSTRNHRGFRDALRVLADVDRLLDNRGGADPLPVQGYRNVFVTRESYDTLRDPDPHIRHVPATYRIDLEEE